MSQKSSSKTLDILVAAFRASCPHGLGSLGVREQPGPTGAGPAEERFTLWHLNHYLIPVFSTSEEIRTLQPAQQGKQAASAPGHGQSLVPVERIYVKMLNGKSTSVSVSAHTTVFDIKKSIEAQLNIPVAAQRMVFRGQILSQHSQYIGTIPLPPDSVVHLIMQDEQHGRPANLHLDSSFLAPRWDFDFSNVQDPPESNHVRGGRRYVRPCGWKRFAVSVIDEYAAGTEGGANDWLGPQGSDRVDENEWPVAYYAPGIGLLNRGIEVLQDAPNRVQIARENPRVRCVTPLPTVAALHAAEFQRNGRTYQFLVQIRFNRSAIVYEADDILLLRDDEDAPRPYGLLIRRKPA